MNIQNAVEILENNGLIIPDEFGRKWSAEYPSGSSFWNPRKSGMQRIRDDGNSSSGVKQEIHYNFEQESPYQITDMRTLSWYSTLCNTSYTRSEATCLLFTPERKAIILEQAEPRKVQLGRQEERILTWRNMKLSEQEGILKIHYEKDGSHIGRVFKGIDEITKSQHL